MILLGWVVFLSFQQTKQMIIDDEPSKDREQEREVHLDQIENWLKIVKHAGIDGHFHVFETKPYCEKHCWYKSHDFAESSHEKLTTSLLALSMVGFASRPN